jgi:hypothetical protein
MSKLGRGLTERREWEGMLGIRLSKNRVFVGDVVEGEREMDGAAEWMLSTNVRVKVSGGCTWGGVMVQDYLYTMCLLSQDMFKTI